MVKAYGAAGLGVAQPRTGCTWASAILVKLAALLEMLAPSSDAAGLEKLKWRKRTPPTPRTMLARHRTPI